MRVTHPIPRASIGGPGIRGPINVSYLPDPIGRAIWDGDSRRGDVLGVPAEIVEDRGAVYAVTLDAEGYAVEREVTL